MTAKPHPTNKGEARAEMSEEQAADLRQGIVTVIIGSSVVAECAVMPFWAWDMGWVSLPFVMTMAGVGCFGVLLCYMGVKEIYDAAT